MMLRVSLLGLCVVAMLACGNDVENKEEPVADESAYGEEYFGGDGYILPRSHVNVARKIVIPAAEAGVALGFDLDGAVSEPGDTQSCGHGDLVDPEGRMGVDNQLARMWPALEPLVGEAVQGLLQGAINEGRMLIMIELSELDDMQNDDDVTLSVFSGSLDPEIGTLGLIAPDQTFYMDYDRPLSSATSVQLVDGELEAGPVLIEIPLNILDANFNLRMEDGQVRIRLNPDGTFTGVLGGAFHVPTVLGELLETGAAAETRLVTPIFESNADMGMTDGGCEYFSTAFEFEGTTAYVVRDPSQE
jgi:hypothetical protein